MGHGTRILLAVLLSFGVIILWDLLVFKPYIEKKRKEMQKSPDVETQVEEKKREERFYNVVFPRTSAVLRTEKIDVELGADRKVKGISINKVVLKEFALLPGSEERYFFKNPLAVFFYIDGKAVWPSVTETESSGREARFKVKADGVEGKVDVRAKDYFVEFAFDLTVSAPKYIAIAMLFSPSMPEKSEFFYISGGKKELDKKAEDVRIFGEKTKYFVFSVSSQIPLEVIKVGEIAVARTKSALVTHGLSRTFKFYAGPKDEKYLVAFNPEMEELVAGGILGPLVHLLLFVMRKLYEVVGNWGVAIILLSVIVRIVFFPLNAISYRSMKKLRDLQPKIEELRKKYKDNKEEFSRRMFELYRQEKINPFSGCLPLLVQIPIFIALYRALYEAIELRHAPFALWIKDLSSPDRFASIGGFDINLLPILMGATFLVQQLVTPQTTGDPTIKFLNWFMPIFFVALLWNLPSGLHLYWITLNILGILQGLWTLRFAK